MGSCCSRPNVEPAPDVSDTWSIDTSDIPSCPEIYEWKTVIAGDDEVFSYGACKGTSPVL